LLLNPRRKQVPATPWQAPGFGLGFCFLVISLSF